ncbi:ribonuclease H2 non-catalytic subunit-domain-containing protein [Gloeopeniophorella convolvens]|nr:ribonuclease H2 non-catalytic subunit-domain-containing protein [Gloeopeniophorella convolvens]
MDASIKITQGPTSLPVRTPHLMPFHIQHTGPAPVSTYFRVQPAPPPAPIPEVSTSASILETSVAASLTTKVVAEGTGSGSPPAPTATTTTTVEATATATVVVAPVVPPQLRPGPIKRLSESAKRFISSFRGRTVQGVEVALPDGYAGIVLRGDAAGRTQVPASSKRRSTRARGKAADAIDVDDAQQEDEAPVRVLKPAARFDTFVLWHPDIPVDEGKDEYLRSLTEWVALAAEVVRKYLEAGYSVRGTVRSVAKSAFLKNFFAVYGDRLEFLIVEDMAADGAFDEAVEGVDIAHTASPFHCAISDPDELIIPAVRGVTSILTSALQHGTAVKRVVFTSIAAIWTTLAERVAWDFVAQHGTAVTWDLVALNPPLIDIFGPSLSPALTIVDIGTSQRELYDLLAGAFDDARVRDGQQRGPGRPPVCTSRLSRGRTFTYQDILDVAAEIGVHNALRAPRLVEDMPQLYTFATTSAEEIFGLEQATSLRDWWRSLRDFAARGYLGFSA